MDFTIYDLISEPRAHTEHFLKLSPDEIRAEIEYLAEVALADVEILHPDDDELQQRTIDNVNEHKPQLIEALQSKAAEHQKALQDQEAEQVIDVIARINETPPDNSIIFTLENGESSETTDTLRLPFYINELEKRLLIDNCSPNKFVTHCIIDEVQFNAFYLKSLDKLILKFATDETHLETRLADKGITNYDLVDFKAEFETEAEQKKKKSFIKEYERYRLAIDMTLTLNDFSGVKERDLFYFLCNMMAEDQKRHKELLAHYFKSPNDDLQNRELLVNGIKSVVERITAGSENKTITFDIFDEKISENLITKLKNIRDKSLDSSEKPLIDKILLKYNFNVLNFKGKMNNARQKIEEANQTKQGAKK